jgi:carbon-monoxide dehydrogenase large subunit
VTDPFKALAPDAPVLREDLAGKTEGAHGPRRTTTTSSLWEQGDKAATEEVIAGADVVAEEMIYYHRTHPCPLEPCGCVASMDKVNGKLTLWGTFQAPHAVRTVASLISGIAEHNIRVISPDIGGGFGNKVGCLSGLHVCSVVASIVTGKPVKWVEDRMDNLMTTAFARDYWMQGQDRRHEGRQDHRPVVPRYGGSWRVRRLRGPDQIPRRLHEHLHRELRYSDAYVGVDGVYTNKAPGGVAYRCSFRVTEAAYFIERMVEVLAIEARHGPGRPAPEELHQKDQFPYQSALGWEYDSGDYHTAWDKALEAVDYDGLRKEQASGIEAFKRGETRKLMGIG